jgi:hypothetical protein
MSSSLFLKVAVVRWLIGSRPFTKSHGFLMKITKPARSVLEDDSSKLSRNTGNKITTSLRNGNINCKTAKTLKLHNIFVFIAKPDFILRLNIRKEV